MKTTNHGGSEKLKSVDDCRFELSALLPMLLICLWLAGCGEKQNSVSQGDKPKMNMHRVQAGELDSKGWCVGESTEGHFHVKFPATFNDSTISGTDTNGQPLTIFALGTLIEGNTKFSAVLTVKNEFKNSTEKDKFFDGFLRSFEKNGSLKSSRRFVFQDRPALEAEVGDKSRSALMRAVLHEGGVYLLIVEFDTGKKAKLGDTIATFMDSLAFPTNTNSLR